MKDCLPFPEFGQDGDVKPAILHLIGPKITNLPLFPSCAAIGPNMLSLDSSTENSLSEDFDEVNRSRVLNISHIWDWKVKFSTLHSQLYIYTTLTITQSHNHTFTHSHIHTVKTFLNTFTLYPLLSIFSCQSSSRTEYTLQSSSCSSKWWARASTRMPRSASSSLRRSRARPTRRLSMRSASAGSSMISLLAVLNTSFTSIKMIPSKFLIIMRLQYLTIW